MNRQLKDIYWLSGLFEGEGCFTINNRTSSTKTFNVRVGSTDIDVLKRAARILDGSVHLSNRNKPWSHKKPYYQAIIHGHKAIGWMMTLYPLMGERRKARIKEIISVWKAYNGRKARS